MREIKFRYWDATQGNSCMVKMDNHYVFRYPSSNYPMTFGDVLRESTSDNPYYKNNALMQYTGQTDKNGKEIYDLDIVRGRFAGIEDDEPGYYEATHLVEWAEWGGWSLVEADCVEEVEVIGNIYENPELLGEADKLPQKSDKDVKDESGVLKNSPEEKPNAKH